MSPLVAEQPTFFTTLVALNIVVTKWRWLSDLIRCPSKYNETVGTGFPSPMQSTYQMILDYHMELRFKSVRKINAKKWKWNDKRTITWKLSPSCRMLGVTFGGSAIAWMLGSVHAIIVSDGKLSCIVLSFRTSKNEIQKIRKSHI